MIEFRSGLLLLMAIAIWGCSNANDNSITLDSSGKHPAGWVVALNGGSHPAMFISAPDKCTECHGTDLKGGISAVSCFSSDRNGMSCHPQGPFGHPAGWSDPAAHGAHAKAAANGANGMFFCTGCHGTDYRGAGASRKDCLRCHTTAPHPAKPWTGTRSHASTDPSNAAACAQCHTAKANLSPSGLAGLPVTATIGSGGCFNNTLCHGVMGHGSDPQPWSLPINHGSRAKADPGAGGNTGFTACQQCHGTSFATVLGANSCVGCHGVAAPHPIAADWRSVGMITHTNTGPNNAAVCAACHNSSSPKLAAPNLARFANSPAGSFTDGSPDCFTASMCHGDVRKTSNCDACHSTATTIPFKSMAGATAVSDSKVGAHVKHLSASAQAPAYSANIACSECHAVPGSPAVSGTHRNGTNDIVFGTLAKTGSLTPVYTTATGVCANTYCHGTTLNGGTNKSPVWNQSGYLAAGCGTCHGFPPATVRNGTAAHSTSSACSGCHSHVNSTNNGFLDASKHINGAVDASGGASHAFPNPGSAHRTATPATCQGCHNTTSTTGVYPVLRGTPPNCAGCHARSLFVGCSDCHGDATGRPNGSTFPNKAGRHSSPGEHAVACAVCHAGGGSGVSAHGNSNGFAKTAADVILRFSITGTVASDSSIVITRSGSTVTCTGVCHITGGDSQSHNSKTW
ncbi:MAG: CxxxxCH/CxxCH domain-containing protein [Pelobacteraceae bacterium]